MAFAQRLDVFLHFWNAWIIRYHQLKKPCVIGNGILGIARIFVDPAALIIRFRVFWIEIEAGGVVA